MKNPNHHHGALAAAINPNTVLLITVIASFSTPFTLSSVNVALPAISRDLNMSALELGWVSLSFLVERLRGRKFRPQGLRHLQPLAGRDDVRHLNRPAALELAACA